jgi:transcriptional regulator with XRE-family HTH domain
MAVYHHLQGVRAIRERLGISAQTVASELGVTVTSYYRFENGSRRIYIDKACKLADLLGISLETMRAAADPRRLDGILMSLAPRIVEADAEKARNLAASLPPPPASPQLPAANSAAAAAPPASPTAGIVVPQPPAPPPYISDTDIGDLPVLDDATRAAMEAEGYTFDD